MNILVLSWRDPKHPLAGGAEQVMHQHMMGWIKAGHRIILFSSFFEGAKKTETIDGIKIIREGDQLVGVKIKAFLWYITGNHPKFDLIVDQFHGIPFFTPLYTKVPILAVIQEVAKEVWFLNELPSPINYIVGPLGYFGEPFTFKFYKNVAFMTGSNSAKQDVISMGISPEHITIIPHGVIIKKPKKSIKKEKTKTIVFLGAMTKDKGVDDALKTFEILNKKDKFNFWLIGRGSVNIPKSIKSNTRSWGYVSQEKKFELLARSHVLINPSSREGWGLVNIEANAMATPVIAYNSMGLIDSVQVGKSGIICDKNTPHDLAKNVRSLLKNKKRYQQLCKTSVTWSRQFDWKVSKSKSLELINKIV